MSVTAPGGFRASGVTAGLKASGTPDVALVVNEGPKSAAAAVFTENRCTAHPVIWSQQVAADGRIDAVVLNSGGANCYTGPDGFQTVHFTAEQVADLLGLSAGDVVVCSTGLIGQQLDRVKLSVGVSEAVTALSPDGGLDAATAIMTTDTHPKQSQVSRDGWTIGGMAKGAGMLAPALATMLVVITTDADLDSPTCDRALRQATGRTFDRLDSDGCMSTNDTVVLMASGASGVSPDEADFAAALEELCQDLAMQLLSDAEGAKHDIAIEVVGAASREDAITAGRTISRSNLLKCAIYGEDANWGRVLSALGTTDAVFEPHQVDVSFNGVRVCIGGAPGEPRELVRFEGRAVTIRVDLHAGPEEVTTWTNDLTVDYVHENSAYST